jgi:hypothetical protein
MSGGMSESALFVEEKERQRRHELFIVGGGADLPLSSLQHELFDVVVECSKPNWNGYNARPVKATSRFRFDAVNASDSRWDPSPIDWRRAGW